MVGSKQSTVGRERERERETLQQITLRAVIIIVSFENDLFDKLI